MPKPINNIREDLQLIETDIPVFIKTGIPENVKSDKIRSLELRQNQSAQDILDWIQQMQNSGILLSGFHNPNTTPPEDDYNVGQLYLQKDQSTYQNLALFIYTGVDGIGWYQFYNQAPSSTIHYGTLPEPQDVSNFEIGDYYVQTSDGTSSGNVLSVLLFTNSSVDNQFVNPYGSKGDKGDTGAPGVDGAPGPQGTPGAQGIQGPKGNNGTNPHIGGNGNWWIGSIDTGVKASAVMQIVYDADISGIRNGTNNTFTVTGAFKAGTLKVYFNGLLLTKGNNDDYIEHNAGASGNGALINRIVTTKDKLIFEFEKL